jgi:hypothetical protein
MAFPKEEHAMSTVYTVHTHPANLITVDDMIAYILPNVERYVSNHYYDFSYDLQQELIQAAITNLWEDTRRGTLKTTQPPSYWMTACKTGITRAVEKLKRETGVRVKQQGKTFIQNRVEYDCDIAFDDGEQSGLEVAERILHQQPGPRDPEGGRLDQQIDFEWLLTKAFSLLKPSEVEDCAALALDLATGEGTGVDFRVQHGWGQDRYYKTLDRLKDVFYQAAQKERPAKQKCAASIDTQKVLALYQQGYGCKRIARLMGCSDSRVGQILQEIRTREGTIARTTKRQYDHHKNQIDAWESESAAD